VPVPDSDPETVPVPAPVTGQRPAATQPSGPGAWLLRGARLRSHGVAGCSGTVTATEPVSETETVPPVAIWELGGPQDRRPSPGGR
jgi:hypothetical protein